MSRSFRYTSPWGTVFLVRIPPGQEILNLSVFLRSRLSRDPYRPQDVLDTFDLISELVIKVLEIDSEVAPTDLSDLETKQIISDHFSYIPFMIHFLDELREMAGLSSEEISELETYLKDETFCTCPLCERITEDPVKKEELSRKIPCQAPKLDPNLHALVYHALSFEGSDLIQAPWWVYQILSLKSWTERIKMSDEIRKGKKDQMKREADEQKREIQKKFKK